MRILIALAAFLLIIIPVSALGQAVTGDLEGWILDQQTGDSIVSVDVTVTGVNLQLPRSSASMSDGFFSIKGLPVGTYTVTILHPDFEQVVYEDVVIQLGRATSLGKTTLAAEVHELEDLVVTASRQTLDFSSTTSGNNLSSEVLNQLPTPRDYREVIAYLPQANTSYLGDATNMAGSTGRENQYFIEGVNVTDPFLADNGTRLPSNFIREIQVKQGGYMPEHGAATGGIVNVITHSGSNEFGGQVFGFLTNNDIASDSRRGIAEFQQTSFSRYDLGVALGGAIARDNLWYFLAYNPTVEKEGLVIPGLSSFEDEAVSHLFAGKLSWSPSPTTTLDLAVFGDPTSHDRVGGSFLISPEATQLNADPLLMDRTMGAVTASLRGRTYLGENAIVEVAISRVEANNRSEAATEFGRTEPTYSDNYTSTLSGGMQDRFDHHTVRWGTELSTTLFVGRHDLKLGLAYDHLALDENWFTETPDGRPGLVYRLGPDFWQVLLFSNVTEVSHRLPSAYLQDSWRVTDRLRLNAGLRWDGIYVADKEGEVVQSINDGYQPRAGFTYRLDDGGRQKLFGSYGRFYEQLPMIASSWFFGDFYNEYLYYDQNPLDSDFAVDPTGGFVFDKESGIADDLRGAYLDEFTLGYGRELGTSWKAGIRGIYRDLGEAIENSFNLDGTSTLGNPGRGSLSYMDAPVRRYSALEFSLESTLGSKLNLAGFYVLSRSYGNYPGVFDADGRNPHSHVSTQYWTDEQSSEGLLPNDRTHVLKIYGSYDFDFGLTTGWFFTWQSGTPLSEYGGTYAGPNAYSHLVPRGTAGRTPSIWDANLRFAYDLSRLTGGIGGTRSRVLFDVFHLFSQEQPVDIDQVRYFGPTYDPADQQGPNRNYGTVRAYQPSMTLRFGLEVSF